MAPGIDTPDKFKAAMADGTIPIARVRLDDHLCSLAGRAGLTHAQLNEFWPAEFDHDGQIRGRRIPLGHPAKAWFPAGTTDTSTDRKEMRLHL